VTENERRLAQGVLKIMDDAKLDVLVYPSWNFPPRLIGDLNTPHGNNSPLVAPPAGFPAITVPMGFARGARSATKDQFRQRGPLPRIKLDLTADERVVLEPET
jgi:hypothetical protein